MHEQRYTRKHPWTPRPGPGRTRRLLLTAVVALVPLAAACGSEKADGGRPGSGSVGVEQAVTGVRWNVDSVTVDGTTHRAPDDAHMTIEDGTAAGTWGCNTFHADAAVEGDRVRLTDVRSTRMACAQAPMAFERLLSRTLTEGVLTAGVDDGELTLSTRDGDRVRLTEG
ncbi:META domain-containing protein [Streptomyces sp. NPDC017936]|uniref:META domain-containing protein n=1 Tax=Streptomyces sp. NPDC017936 TaxID=3365016 RepID=UPI0037A4B5EC